MHRAALQSAGVINWGWAADWTQAEIEKQIPRIVSLLGSADSRDVVRTAFASALQKMTPADLLVALHTEESARKATIEGEQSASSCQA